MTTPPPKSNSVKRWSSSPDSINTGEKNLWHIIYNNRQKNLQLIFGPKRKEKWVDTFHPNTMTGGIGIVKPMDQYYLI